MALPDRSLWTRLEEAMGVPVPDPRVPEYTTAERELIDTLLLVTDELRLLREQLAKGLIPEPTPNSGTADPGVVVNVNGAAECLGVSTSLIRTLVAERRIVFYKLGSRVMFRRSDLDNFLESGKRKVGGYEPWQLRGRSGNSPRKSN